MQLLTREAILGANDLTAEVVEVPEWGGAVRVRVLTAAERDQFEASVLSDGVSGPARVGNIRARLAALTLCDEAGAPLFTPDDLEALGAKSAAAMDRIFDVASRLNAFSKKDVDELGKGSAAGLSASSPSDSPSASA